MKNYPTILCAATILCVATILLGCQAKAGPTDALKPAGVIPLDGVEGRIDHMAVDAAAGGCSSPPSATTRSR